MKWALPSRLRSPAVRQARRSELMLVKAVEGARRHGRHDRPPMPNRRHCLYCCPFPAGLLCACVHTAQDLSPNLRPIYGGFVGDTRRIHRVDTRGTRAIRSLDGARARHHRGLSPVSLPAISSVVIMCLLVRVVESAGDGGPGYRCASIRWSRSCVAAPTWRRRLPWRLAACSGTSIPLLRMVSFVRPSVCALPYVWRNLAT